MTMTDEQQSSSCPCGRGECGLNCTFNGGQEWLPGTCFRVMPADLNPDGAAYGAGVACDHIDTTATWAAQRVHGGRVTTRALNVEFLHPILLADRVQAYYRIVKVGRSSITIEVRLDVIRHGSATDGGTVEQLIEGAAKAMAVFVALNNDGEKTLVDGQGTGKPRDF